MSGGLSIVNLARKKGISRARVTQILNLLKLAPEIQEMVVRLGDPLLSPSVTERKLRVLLSLTARQQKQRLEMLLSNR
jgi:L-lysine 2,3-aminomutase